MFKSEQPCVHKPDTSPHPQNQESDLPDTEAGVFDLELTEPGEGSGRSDEPTEFTSNLASSVEFS